MTTSHQHNHRHHRHPPLCLLVPFPPNSLVARSEEGSCGSARCSTTDDTATPHSPHCSSYIFTLQTIHYEFKIMFWILVSAPQLITHVCRWFSFFWFLSSLSRTRARAVWSLGCLKLMPLAMMMICRTFISQSLLTHLQAMSRCTYFCSARYSRPFENDVI